jgi:puromycin-sensitive aminopeptidase
VVAATGDADDYERLLDGYHTAATPQDQLRHLYALADFDDEAWCFAPAVYLTTGEDTEPPFLLRMAIANRHPATRVELRAPALGEASAAFPANTIVRMVSSVSMLTTEHAVADVQGFFTEHPIPQGAKTLDQTLERQRVNAALRERERVDLAAAL